MTKKLKIISKNNIKNFIEIKNINSDKFAFEFIKNNFDNIELLLFLYKNDSLIYTELNKISDYKNYNFINIIDNNLYINEKYLITKIFDIEFKNKNSDEIEFDYDLLKKYKIDIMFLYNDFLHTSKFIIEEINYNELVLLCDFKEIKTDIGFYKDYIEKFKYKNIINNLDEILSNIENIINKNNFTFFNDIKELKKIFDKIKINIKNNEIKKYTLIDLFYDIITLYNNKITENKNNDKIKLNNEIIKVFSEIELNNYKDISDTFNYIILKSDNNNLNFYYIKIITNNINDENLKNKIKVELISSDDEINLNLLDYVKIYKEVINEFNIELNYDLEQIIKLKDENENYVFSDYIIKNNKNILEYFAEIKAKNLVKKIKFIRNKITNKDFLIETLNKKTIVDIYAEKTNKLNYITSNNNREIYNNILKYFINSNFKIEYDNLFINEINDKFFINNLRFSSFINRIEVFQKKIYELSKIDEDIYNFEKKLLSNSTINNFDFYNYIFVLNKKMNILTSFDIFEYYIYFNNNFSITLNDNLLNKLNNNQLTENDIEYINFVIPKKYLNDNEYIFFNFKTLNYNDNLESNILNTYFRLAYFKAKAIDNNNEGLLKSWLPKFLLENNEDELFVSLIENLAKIADEIILKINLSRFLLIKEYNNYIIDSEFINNFLKNLNLDIELKKYLTLYRTLYNTVEKENKYLLKQNIVNIKNEIENKIYFYLKNILNKRGSLNSFNEILNIFGLNYLELNADLDFQVFKTNKSNDKDIETIINNISELIKTIKINYKTNNSSNYPYIAYEPPLDKQNYYYYIPNSEPSEYDYLILKFINPLYKINLNNLSQNIKYNLLSSKIKLNNKIYYENIVLDITNNNDEFIINVNKITTDNDETENYEFSLLNITLNKYQDNYTINNILNSLYLNIIINKTLIYVWGWKPIEFYNIFLNFIKNNNSFISYDNTFSADVTYYSFEVNKKIFSFNFYNFENNKLFFGKKDSNIGNIIYYSDNTDVKLIDYNLLFGLEYNFHVTYKNNNFKIPDNYKNKILLEINYTTVKDYNDDYIKTDIAINKFNNYYEDIYNYFNLYCYGINNKNIEYFVISTLEINDNTNNQQNNNINNIALLNFKDFLSNKNLELNSLYYDYYNDNVLYDNIKKNYIIPIKITEINNKFIIKDNYISKTNVYFGSDFYKNLRSKLSVIKDFNINYVLNNNQKNKILNLINDSFNIEYQNIYKLSYLFKKIIIFLSDKIIKDFIPLFVNFEYGIYFKDSLYNLNFEDYFKNNISYENCGYYSYLKFLNKNIKTDYITFYKNINLKLNNKVLCYNLTLNDVIKNTNKIKLICEYDILESKIIKQNICKNINTKFITLENTLIKEVTSQIINKKIITLLNNKPKLNAKGELYNEILSKNENVYNFYIHKNSFNVLKTYEFNGYKYGYYDFNFNFNVIFDYLNNIGIFSEKIENINNFNFDDSNNESYTQEKWYLIAKKYYKKSNYTQLQNFIKTYTVFSKIVRNVVYYYISYLTEILIEYDVDNWRYDLYDNNGNNIVLNYDYNNLKQINVSNINKTVKIYDKLNKLLYTGNFIDISVDNTDIKILHLLNLFSLVYCNIFLFTEPIELYNNSLETTEECKIEFNYNNNNTKINILNSYLKIKQIGKDTFDYIYFYKDIIKNRRYNLFNFIFAENNKLIFSNFDNQELNKNYYIYNENNNNGNSDAKLYIIYNNLIDNIEREYMPYYYLENVSGGNSINDINYFLSMQILNHYFNYFYDEIILLIKNYLINNNSKFYLLNTRDELFNKLIYSSGYNSRHLKNCYPFYSISKIRNNKILFENIFKVKNITQNNQIIRQLYYLDNGKYRSKNEVDCYIEFIRKDARTIDIDANKYYIFDGNRYINLSDNEINKLTTEL